MSVRVAFGECENPFLYSTDRGTKYHSNVSLNLKEYLLYSIGEFNQSLYNVQTSPKYTKILVEGRLKDELLSFTENSVNFKKYWKIRANDNDDVIDLAMSIRLFFHLQPVWDLYNSFKTLSFLSTTFQENFGREYHAYLNQYLGFFAKYTNNINACPIDSIDMPFLDACFNGSSIVYNCNDSNAFTVTNITEEIGKIRTYLNTFIVLFQYSKPIQSYFTVRGIVMRSFNQKEKCFFWDSTRIALDIARITTNSGKQDGNASRDLNDSNAASIAQNTSNSDPSASIQTRRDCAPNYATNPSCVRSGHKQNLMQYLYYALCDCVSVLKATFKDQEQFKCTENNHNSNSIFSVDTEKQRHEFDVFNTMRRLIQDFPSVFGRPREVDPYRVCESPQHVYRFSCIPHVSTNGWVPGMDCMACIERQHSQQEHLRDCAEFSSHNDGLNTDETCDSDNNTKSCNGCNQSIQSVVTQCSQCFQSVQSIQIVENSSPQGSQQQGTQSQSSQQCSQHPHTLPSTHVSHSSASTQCVHCLRSTYLPYGPNCKPMDLKSIESMLSSKVIKLTKETIELFVENFYERITRYALRMHRDANHRKGTSKECRVGGKKCDQKDEPSVPDSTDSCDSENLDTNQRKQLIIRMQDTLQGMKTESD